jgi:hypothetical protein
VPDHEIPEMLILLPPQGSDEYESLLARGAALQKTARLNT